MSILKTAPAVFAVGDTYQIMVPVTDLCLMWVKVGEDCYYDDSNGIIRSDVTTHRMVVPIEELDRAGGYTICYRRMFERLPYFSDTGDVEEVAYSFRPVPADGINLYHISDAHDGFDGPIAAAKHFEAEAGKIDLLVLNGDIITDYNAIEDFDKIYKFIEEVTGGEIPTVFTRGNHDTRGILAEKLADHTPVDGGNSYFTFRCGGLWGIVLDCGEDKPGVHYGNTLCSHEFHRRQVKFLERVIKNAASEYAAEGVRYKAVISHVPFYRAPIESFNIEEEIYTKWCSLIGEHIKPHIMIHGHKHSLSLNMPGHEADVIGLPCPDVIASAAEDRVEHFIGGGFIFADGAIDVVFNDKNMIHERHRIEL
ncbi:MAG: metallophosphoesterase [Clostridia bacterium]|nr:metallophosphoesterase [Clostridia bacterium]